MGATPAMDDATRALARRLAFAAAAGVVGALLAWLGTTPAALVHINWDAGSYLHQIASGGITWSSPPWNAHFALQYAYFAATWIARALGGTPADGFRLLNAFCLGLSSALVADAARHLTRSRWLGALLTAAWLTAFVTCFLVFTLEDNIVFLTPGIAVLWLCAVRIDRWGWLECVVAGLLGAAAALMSIQGVLYLAPPCGLTLLLRPRSVPWRRRAAQTAIVIGAFAAGALLFVLFVAATSTMTARQLLAILASRPEPSHFPRTGPEIRTLLLDWRGSLRTIGLATSFQLFQNHVVFDTPAALIRLGGIALFAQVGLWAGTGLMVWRRKEGAAAHLLAATLLLFTLLTSLYRDVEYAYLKRTDFMPLLGVLLAAGAVGPRFVSVRPRLIALGVALAAIVTWQSYSSLRWRAAEVSAYATLDDTILRHRVPGYHGTTSGSYFRRFRMLRAEHPRACAFVFDVTDVAHGRWNPDITGLLWSELPGHRVLGPAAEMKAWRRPVRWMTPADAHAKLTRGCEWLSDTAKRRLGRK